MQEPKTYCLFRINADTTVAWLMMLAKVSGTAPACTCGVVSASAPPASTGSDGASTLATRTRAFSARRIGILGWLNPQLVENWDPGLLGVVACGELGSQTGWACGSWKTGVLDWLALWLVESWVPDWLGPWLMESWDPGPAGSIACGELRSQTGWAHG
ncbi:hypothetical protein O3P69_008228 [Scylla paramamosain]|uniref:Uncharacterized protein n=1 Tax=Scylla paramamosain TaxID=85552 RepID=A0AAW0T2I3_SCYPA